MPLCFAIGWLLRGWSFEGEVEAEARELVTHVYGSFVPELGVFVETKDDRDHYDELAAQKSDDVQRRIEFFRQLRIDSSVTVPLPILSQDQNQPGEEP